MRKGVAIADMVTAIASKGSSVLFLDTCAILDIIRPLKRKKVHDLMAAKDILDQIDKGEFNCQIVLSSRIDEEYADNLEDTRLEHLRFVKHLMESWKSYYDANAIFGNPTDRLNIINDPLCKQMKSLTDRILDTGIHMLEQDNLHARASKRTSRGLPPAAKGKQELKDCIIVEECLELCRQLNVENTLGSLFFLTSNDNDYRHEKSIDLKEPLRSEFQSLGLNYSFSWGYLLNQIKIEASY